MGTVGKGEERKRRGEGRGKKREGKRGGRDIPYFLPGLTLMLYSTTFT